jgi:hypothetical protein
VTPKKELREWGGRPADAGAICLPDRDLKAPLGGALRLVLQLHFRFKMCLLRHVLMSPSPQRPSYCVGGADTFLREPVCYPPDFPD